MGRNPAGLRPIVVLPSPWCEPRRGEGAETPAPHLSRRWPSGCVFGPCGCPERGC